MRMLLGRTRLDFVRILPVSVTQVFECVTQWKRKRPLTPLTHVRQLVYWRDFAPEPWARRLAELYRRVATEPREALSA